MEDRPQEEESWMKIRRIASQNSRGVKSPPQVHSYDAPPSPPFIPVKEDPNPYVAASDNERLVWNSAHPIAMQNRQDQKQSASFSGISAPILLFLACYSTVLSGIWFLLAVIKPHYGFFIGTGGANISPSTASTVVAGVAKTIELSFVTVFLACLGQFFTKQALNTISPGISLADIQLKQMIVQPGSLLTQWRSYGLVWKSMLGFISLLACFTGTLYTTASDALVTPVRSLHPPVVMPLLGPVAASVANLFYVEQICPSPISVDEDPLYEGYTCQAVADSAFAYQNYVAFVSSWNHTTRSKDGVSLSQRPPPTAIFNDNTTAQGNWVEPISVFNKDNRIVSNVSMAMPHAGVVAASSLQTNKLLQVEGTDNIEELDINARTVVPVINVLCAAATEEELKPIVYTNFSNPANSSVVNATSWPNAFNSTGWYNKTVFDDLFGFTFDRPPPLFFNLPPVYNTNLNSSGNRPDAMYVLLNSNFTAVDPNLPPYTLCGMSMTLRTGCSTTLQALVSGSTISLDCGAGNDMAYTPLPTNNGSSWDRNREWVSIASGLALATSLSAGITANDASTARILTQLAPSNSTLNPWRPHLAETFAVLLSNTLLSSTTDAPFDGAGPFNGTVTAEAILPTPSLQPFTATVQVSDYASGGSASWQNVFVIILVPVFLLNCLCLVYLAFISVPQRWLPRGKYHNPNQPQYGPGGAPLPYQSQHPYLHSGVQRDYTDLQNLFVLALGTAEPREGSLMREKTNTWTGHNGPTPGKRTSILSTTDPSKRAERDERHRLLGTKWHIQEKRPVPQRSTSSGLGLGLDSSADGTPHMGGAGGYGTVAGVNGYHIVVDGEQQQHHFRRRAAQPERVRGRFEKYLSPRFSSTGHSPSSSVDADNRVPRVYGKDMHMGMGSRNNSDNSIRGGMDGSGASMEMKDIARQRHISGPTDVKNSVGIAPEIMEDVSRTGTGYRGRPGSAESEGERVISRRETEIEMEMERQRGMEMERGMGGDVQSPEEIGGLGGELQHPWHLPSIHNSPFGSIGRGSGGSGNASRRSYRGSGGGGGGGGGGGEGWGYDFVELGPGTPGMGREF